MRQWTLTNEIKKQLKLFFSGIFRQFTASGKSYPKILNITTCKQCGGYAEEKTGTTKHGKPYHGIFCIADERHKEWLSP